jgi:hypothetical protein
VTQRKRVRVEATVREHDRLLSEFARWSESRTKADKAGQYATQLESLTEFVNFALHHIREDLPEPPDALGVGDVYARCRDGDERLNLVQRFWEFYRRRWDQRDDRTTLGPLLLAADEVVFSCYRRPFEATGSPRGPVPLPYIEPALTPHAITRDEPPSDLATADPLLHDYINRLPIPVIGLPPACVDAPWLLVHLAHEAGHHVQHDLADGALITAMAQTVRASARAAGADGDEWAGWSQEVFADAFALLCVGEAAPWSIAELEFGRDEDLLEGAYGYPPPVVRQALLRSLAACAGLDAGRTLPAPTPTPTPDDLGGCEEELEALRLRAREDLKAAPAVARVLATGKLGELGRLRDLCGWDPSLFRRTGAAATWRDRLRGTTRFTPRRHPREACLAIAGAVAAWHDVASVANDRSRAQERDRLRGRVVEYLPKTRPPGRRAAREPRTPVRDLAEAFTHELFARAPRSQEEPAGAR